MFSASVPVAMRGAVEVLFFLNRRQQLLHRAISSTIEQTGIPKMMELDGRVWIDGPSHTMQCLFACGGAFAPIGVALYERPSTDILSAIWRSIQHMRSAEFMEAVVSDFF